MPSGRLTSGSEGAPGWPAALVGLGRRAVRRGRPRHRRRRLRWRRSTGHAAPRSLARAGDLHTSVSAAADAPGSGRRPRDGRKQWPSSRWSPRTSTTTKISWCCCHRPPASSSSGRAVRQCPRRAGGARLLLHVILSAAAARPPAGAPTARRCRRCAHRHARQPQGCCIAPGWSPHQQPTPEIIQSSYLSDALAAGWELNHSSDSTHTTFGPRRS